MLTTSQQQTLFIGACVPLRFLVIPERRAKKLNGLESFSESACYHRLHSLCWTLDHEDAVELLNEEERVALTEFMQVYESLPWRVIESHPFISELPDENLSPLVPAAEKLLRMLETHILKEA